MGYISLAFMALAIGLLCGYVLYNAARKHHRNPWVWSIVGLVLNVFGLMIFRFTVGKLV